MKSSRMILCPLGRAAAGVVVIAQLAGVAMAQPLDRPVSGSYHQDYSDLAQRNIFLKDRALLIKAPSGPVARPSARQSLVVTGIVFNDQQEYVLVENVLDGSVRRLVEGDRIANGTVIDIAIDAMRFAPDNGDGGSISVRSGANLMGTIVDSVAAERRRWTMRAASEASTLPALKSGIMNPGRQ